MTSPGEAARNGGAARNITRGTVLASAVESADGLWAKFMGLMGRTSLPDGAALWLPDSNGIHMMFMRFPIDAVFDGRTDGEDGARRVVSVHPALGDLVAIGPEPVATAELVANLSGVQITSGNTERYVLTDDRPPPSAEDVIAHVSGRRFICVAATQTPDRRLVRVLAVCVTHKAEVAISRSRSSRIHASAPSPLAVSHCLI